MIPQTTAAQRAALTAVVALALGCAGAPSQAASQAPPSGAAPTRPAAPAGVAAPDAALSQIFEGFPGALAFARAAPEPFRIELLGEDPGDPGSPRVRAVRELLELLADPGASGLEREAADALLADVLALLARQTRANPLKYVSHGADHSVRVMDWARRIHAGVPAVQRGMAARYRLPERRARLALMLAALLHDVGYADLAEHRVRKWLHAPAGGKMVRALLEVEGRGERVGGAELQRDLVRAVAEHNFDDERCLWREGRGFRRCEASIDPGARPEDPRSATTPLLRCEGPCQDADVHCAPPCRYTRAYSRADAEQQPLAFVVRLADNLDATFDRLTRAQRAEATLRYLLRLYVDAELRAAMARGDEAGMERARARVEQAAPGLEPRGKAADMIRSATAETFLHFYSNWIVQGMELAQRGADVVIEVKLREGVPADLAFARHPGVALYQVNRLASASAALTLEGRPLLDAVEVRLSQAAPGAPGPPEGRGHPLRGFTRGDSFSAAGRAGRLCGPSCDLARHLTSSGEPCLDAAGAETGCPGPFEEVAPFTDLTYRAR